MNPSHELFVKLREHFGRSGDDAVLARYAELLFGYALTAEGAYLPDPARFNSLLAELMVREL